MTQHKQYKLIGRYLRSLKTKLSNRVGWDGSGVMIFRSIENFSLEFLPIENCNTENASYMKGLVICFRLHLYCCLQSKSCSRISEQISKQGDILNLQCTSEFVLTSAPHFSFFKLSYSNLCPSTNMFRTGAPKQR